MVAEHSNGCGVQHHGESRKVVGYGAGWLEPLDAYMGKPADVMKPYLPVYASSNVVDRSEEHTSELQSQ